MNDPTTIPPAAVDAAIDTMVLRRILRQRVGCSCGLPHDKWSVSIELGTAFALLGALDTARAEAARLRTALASVADGMRGWAGARTPSPISDLIQCIESVLDNPEVSWRVVESDGTADTAAADGGT